MLAKHKLKNTIALLFISTLFHVATAQKLQGKWYLLHSRGFAEYNFEQDTVKIRQLFFNLNSKWDYFISWKILSKETYQNRYFLSTESPFNKGLISLSDITNIKKNTFDLVWNIADTSDYNLNNIVNYHKSCNKELFTYTVFSKQMIDSLNQLKSIDSMNLTDFKKYLNLYIQNIKTTEKEDKTSHAKLLASIANPYQQITKALIQCGYNPINDRLFIQDLHKKFVKLEEIKQILSSNNISEFDFCRVE